MKMLVVGLLSCMAMVFPMAAEAAVKMEPMVYGKGETRLVGQVAWDDSLKGHRPAVLVVHEWWGLNDYARERARALASLGYLALAADIYGEGFATKDPTKARELAGKFRGGDRALLRERVIAAFEALKGHPLADKRRIAAIGYCFGGTAVLELARTGQELSGVVSFHGGLSTPVTAAAGGIGRRSSCFMGRTTPVCPRRMSRLSRRR